MTRVPDHPPTSSLHWVGRIGTHGPAREVLAHITEVETRLERLAIENRVTAPAETTDVDTMLDGILGTEEPSPGPTDLETILASVNDVLATVTGTSRLNIKPKESGRTITPAPAHEVDLVELTLRGVRYH